MSEERAAWIPRAIATICAATDVECARHIREAWQGLTSRRHPHMTMLGPYSSGKSSLLKRLLVEAEVEVPDWLAIGARRETFEVHEARVEDWSFSDTPGIDTGGLAYQQLARDTLCLSDAFMVILTPQLLTAGDHSELIQLLSGRHFDSARGRRYPAGALHVVVARMDEAGVDPGEDMDTFRELVAAKREELQAILIAAHVDPGDVELSFVVADPGGQVGNSKHTKRSDYDYGRRFDGIEHLKHALEAAMLHHKQMREDAHVRFLLCAGNATREQLNSEIAALDESIGESERNRGHRNRFDARLEATITAASQSLRQAIDEILGPNMECTDAMTLTTSLKRSLPIALESWQAEWNPKLSELALTELASTAGLDLGLDATEVKEIINLLAVPAAVAPEASRGKKWLGALSLAPDVRNIATGLVEARMGRSLPQAQRQLAIQANVHHGDGDPVSLAGFSSKAEAIRTRHYVTAVERGSTLLQAAGELAKIAEQIGEARNAAQRETLTEQWCERARSAALGIGDVFLEGSTPDGIKGWLGGAARLRAGVHKLFPVDDALEKERATKLAARRRLEAILTEAPGPDAQ